MKIHTAALLCLSFVSVVYSEEEGGGFEITGMKCFSDQKTNKAEVGKDGFKFQASFGLGGKPGDELKDFTFPETQKKQYFEFQFGPGSEGKTVTVILRGERTTLGIGNKVVEVSGAIDKEGKLPAEWSLKRDWPVGFYKAYFTCEGKPVGSAGYVVKAVKERETPIEATGVKILSFKGDKPTEKTTLSPEDNDLIIKCATKGAHTSGAKVHMFIRSAGEDGKVVPKSEANVDDWPLEDTEIIYSYEMSKGLPVGSYEFVTEVNEKEITTHPFKVEG